MSISDHLTNDYEEEQNFQMPDSPCSNLLLSSVTSYGLDNIVEDKSTSVIQYNIDFSPALLQANVLSSNVNSSQKSSQNFHHPSQPR